MADPLENQLITNEEEETDFLTGLENSEFEKSQPRDKKSQKQKLGNKHAQERAAKAKEPEQL